ncbi:hypothetical protein K9O30_18445 [Clostridium bowmanii]|uniref:hypothetical protein n=1 Tax=Clostridium bowmanii TaxID=132925 RepID=UPI001C0D11F2|nr:hypothetical protein [Clostridium bowmanii]MBU3191219.1 hypothetical protein [Clostridium bowmanii]MCA1075667.1 hypothetical protein [Clostridium bowmanii]
MYNKGKAFEQNDDSINGIEFYQRALMLYKGDYLSEDFYNEWVTPIRNYYHRIYGNAYYINGKSQEQRQ